MAVAYRIKSIMWRGLFAAIVLGIAIAAKPVFAADNKKAAEPVAQTVSIDVNAQAMPDWSARIDEIEQAIQSKSMTTASSHFYRSRINSLRAKIKENRSIAAQQLDMIKRRLEALGAAPAEGEPPEAEQIANKRKEINEKHALARFKVTEAELAMSRLEDLDYMLSSLGRKRLMGDLSEQGPVPIYPSVLINAVSESGKVFAAVIRSPFDWYNSLTDEQKKTAKLDLLPVLLVVFIAVGAAFWGHRVLLRKYGFNAKIEDPAYGRKLLATIVEAVARGIVPAGVLGVFMLWLNSHADLMHGLFAVAVARLLLVTVGFVLVSAFSHAVLAPNLPQWRLTALEPGRARVIDRWIIILAGTTGLYYFVEAILVQTAATAELKSFVLGGILVLMGVLFLALMRDVLWRQRNQPEDSEDEDKAVQDDKTTLQKKSSDDSNVVEPEEHRLWIILRFAAVGLCFAGVCAVLVGYTALGEFLIKRLIFCAFVIAVLMLVRGLLAEGVKTILMSELLRKKFRLKLKALKKLRFWLMLLVNPAIVIAGLFLLLPTWGVPQEDLLLWAEKLITGFEIGGVQISLVDIALAMVVFFAVTTLSTAARKLLLEKVLSETALDKSVQHSLAAAIGYVGVILAATLAIVVLGVDLSSLALIAGALSVGIGFGLNNVVNNFVSGIIILVERPIKVGDWVLVNNNEGFVKQINIRATELETWQRASIIIPNAEILSSSVINLTHKDRYGRIEIAVGVAYGSDVEKVLRLMHETAAEHPHVLGYPEPKVLFTEFGNSSLNFELRCHTANVTERMHIGSDLRIAIDNKFRANDVEIPFPQRVLHFAKSHEIQEQVAAANAKLVAENSTP